MKFECGDLERALAISELMPEAREHLRNCALCRREYRVWNEISTAAKNLHEEWESPLLWPGIRRALEAEEKKAKPAPWRQGRMWAVAAAVAMAVGLLMWTQLYRFEPAKKAPEAERASVPGQRDFLTEQALAEVERTEAAYRQSIEKLSSLAAPQLRNPGSALAANYREKLLTLDSAITETRDNLDHNRFNVRLQMELAGLYREKQQTLKELLTRDQTN